MPVPQWLISLVPHQLIKQETFRDVSRDSVRALCSFEPVQGLTFELTDGRLVRSNDVVVFDNFNHSVSVIDQNTFDTFFEAE